MNPLAVILEMKALNANKLGGLLDGASASNVYKWANGDAPLPGYRAEEIARVLGLSPVQAATLNELVSADARSAVHQDPGEAVTYLGYAFAVTFREDDEEKYGDSLTRFAKLAGISPNIASIYIAGNELIPLDEVVAIADALSPFKPDWAIGGLSHEVAAEPDEPGRFNRLRTDLSNVDSREDIDDILVEYDTPSDQRPMVPIEVLNKLGVRFQDTHPTANDIALRFADARRNS